jgi:hypothetical protein
VPSDITASTHSLDHEFLIAARQAQDITARQKLINLTTAFDSLTGLGVGVVLVGSVATAR